MQKTFKKAIACLLAVLMLICAVPFTATAAGPTQWWITDGVDSATVKAEPSYIGYQDFGLDFGTEIDLTNQDFIDAGFVSNKDNFKPIVAVTVSTVGNRNDSLKDTKNSYYTASTAKTYSAVKADGKIVDPTNIKKDQIIAVTIEFGGFDMLTTLDLKGTFSSALTPGTINAALNKFTAKTAGNVAMAKTAASFYGTNGVNAVGGGNVNADDNSYYISVCSDSFKGGGDASVYIGNRPFGEYGIVVATMLFVANEDCDLTDTNVFNFGNGDTYVTPITNKVAGSQDSIGIGLEPTYYANPLVIYPDAPGATREYDVAVSSSFSNGTVTMDDVTVNPETGATKKVKENNVVKLVATADEGAKFLGWKANNGTTVSTEPEINPVINANVTYTPVFAKASAGQIILKFVDAFDNIVDFKVIDQGTTPDPLPVVPARAGYKAVGWSVTDFTTLKEDTVITPIYTKITDKEYTVEVPAGSTIKVGNGDPQSVPSVSVPYNTQVTVYNASAKSWKINGATVAYGDTYTFYVGANVVLTIDETPVTVQTPVVGSVNIDVSADGKRVSFLATRKIDTAEGWVQVNAGFMYGTTGVTASTELVDVNGTSVKAVYTKTDSEQFSISFNVTPGKTYNGRAFITYKNAADEINVAYANLQTYNA